MSNEVHTNESQKLVGVLAQFDDPHSLLHACENARDSGIRKMDAYTPFPVHGIEKAIGIPRTILPFIVLAIGLGACAAGLGLQWYTNATEQLLPVWSGYQFKISGKPLFSLPANIPVTFEIIVLSSAFAAFFGMLILNRLPRLANPLHRVARFKRVTSDKFFLMVEADDEYFDADRIRSRLADWGATEIEEVHEDQTDHGLPPFLKTVGVLAAILALIPPVLIFRASGMTYKQTRLHVVPDMDFQIKYKPQTAGPVAQDEDAGDEYFFEHIRSSFKPLPGTVARDSQSDDSEFFHGIQAGSELHTSHRTTAALVSTTQEETTQEETTQEQTTQEETGGASQEETADPAATQTPPEVNEPDWVTTIPHQVPVNRDTVLRGQRQYDIYCSVCHGYSGDGDGLANQRALALATNGDAAWTEAKSLYDPEVVKQPVGRLYDTITNGRATMGPYAARISPEDRWAIVLYIKALQEARKNAVTDEAAEPPAN